MFRPAPNPASLRGARVPDNKTFHAQEFPHAGEAVRPWSEESCGRRAHSRFVVEYSRARPATRHQTRFATAKPRRTSALEVPLPAARGRKSLSASLSDHT